MSLSLTLLHSRLIPTIPPNSSSILNISPPLTLPRFNFHSSSAECDERDPSPKSVCHSCGASPCRKRRFLGFSVTAAASPDPPCRWWGGLVPQKMIRDKNHNDLKRVNMRVSPDKRSEEFGLSHRSSSSSLVHKKWRKLTWAYGKRSGSGGKIVPRQYYVSRCHGPMRLRSWHSLPASRRWCGRRRRAICLRLAPGFLPPRHHTWIIDTRHKRLKNTVRNVITTIYCRLLC